MLKQDHTSRAPYPSAIWQVVPIVGLALSVPTLLESLALGGWAVYHALTGQVLDLSVLSPFFQLPLAPAIAVLYTVFGPMAACAMCLTQRACAHETYGSVLLLGFRMKRMNTIALYVAASALVAVAGLVLLLVIMGMLTSD